MRMKRVTLFSHHRYGQTSAETSFLLDYHPIAKEVQLQRTRDECDTTRFLAFACSAAKLCAEEIWRKLRATRQRHWKR
jgi:hypothetical protein